MNKITITIGSVALVAVFGVVLFHDKVGERKISYRDATYIIDGTHVTLKDGISEVAVAPGSASKLVTKYFGNEAVGDLNGDGIDDIAFLLTQEGGGSGTFYYVT